MVIFFMIAILLQYFNKRGGKKLSIIDKALAKGQKTLSEYESKLFLSSYGIPVTREILVTSLDEAIKAAAAIGFPVVLKGSSPDITHKTELNLVALNLKNKQDVAEACARIIGIAERADILVQEMVGGERELAAGLIRNQQFGPCVMLGLGGIIAEALADVAFRVAPLSARDALDIQNDFKGSKILAPFRGKKEVNRQALVNILQAIGEIGLKEERIKEIDLNPVKITDEGNPVVVDALIALNSL